MIALGVAEFDDDRAAVDPLDDAVDHLADALRVVAVDHRPFGLANPLEEDLPRRLGRDSAERGGVQRLELDDAADLDVRIELPAFLEGQFDLGILDLFDDHSDPPRLDLAGLGIDLGVDAAVFVLLARCRRNRLGDGIDQLLGIDVPFRRELSYEGIDVQLHCRFFPSFMIASQSTSSRVSKTCSKGRSTDPRSSSSNLNDPVVDPEQLAGHDPVFADSRLHLDLDPLAGEPCVVIRGVELPVESGRAHLEGVGVADRDRPHRAAPRPGATPRSTDRG